MTRTHRHQSPGFYSYAPAGARFTPPKPRMSMRGSADTGASVRIPLPHRHGR